MDTIDPYLLKFREMSYLSDRVFEQYLNKGQPLKIPSMTILNQSTWLQNKSYYLQEGIIREFYIDKKGKEHTMRFVQAPSVIFPDWTDFYIQSKTIISFQSLTKLKGLAWDLSETKAITAKYPEHNRMMLLQIVQALRQKNQREIRQHQCSALERYQLFLKEFPGLVNVIPLKFIASYLSMAPETISRIRSEMSLIGGKKKFDS